MPFGLRGRPGRGWFRAVHVVLQLGTQGQMVEHLQELLGMPMTGIFDAATQTALTSFQHAQSLPPDGICNSDDWVALHPAVQEGDYGAGVSEVQFALGMSPTGVADTSLTDLVTTYQHNLGLDETGQVGEAEYNTLIM